MEVVFDSGTGLYVAGEGAESDTIGALLRAHDPDLRLVPRFDEEREMRRWDVYRYRGPDQPSEFVCAWQTRDGTPLPLSSNILNLVQTLDKTTSAPPPDPDASNAARKREIAKQKERDHEAIVDDWLMPHGRPVLPRGVGLRMARDKQRARGRKV